MQSVQKAALERLEGTRKRITDCIETRKLQFDRKYLDDPRWVIRWGFRRRNEKVRTASEKFKSNVAHALMCEHSIRRMMEFLIADLDSIYEDNDRLSTKSYASEVAVFTWMVRAYLHVNREAQIMVDLLKILDYYVETARAEEGCDHVQISKPPTGGFASMVIDEEDFSKGGRDVLLMHSVGRLTAAPLLRAAIEVAIQRIVLAGKSTTGKQLDPDNARFSKVRNACQTLGIELNPSTESIDRIYEWASRAVHLGLTYSPEELWFSYIIGENVFEMPLGNSYQNLSILLDHLLSKQKGTHGTQSTARKWISKFFHRAPSAGQTL